MTKHKLLLSIAILSYVLCISAQEWKPAGDRIKTSWAEQVNSASPLPEYPRPQLERDQWINLNGLWGYAILPRGSAMPSETQGNILVPFAIESALSGVQKKVGADNDLWYSRKFAVPPAWKNRNVILHFGAADWKTDVWINNIKVGSHTGGYTPFSFDITPYLNKEGEQKIDVRCWDPTDKGFQPRGKQVNRPNSIWYTSVTGIWQTVWLEPVGQVYIKGLKTVPNVDGKTVSVWPEVEGDHNGDLIEVKVFNKGTLIGTGKSAAGEEVLVGIPDPVLWSPESPFLYDLQISIIRNSRPVDQIKSYFGMRKISTRRDENGIVRLQLNNKDYFQFGPLDQGWWPDGLYTAPTDEALRFDIVKTKELGFNMIRKHVKVEPARWYYHCDQEGILVWQDMPSGDETPDWQMRNYFEGKELERTVESEANYRKEWKEIMNLCYSSPSVVIWVPFNEAWGQFKTKEIAEWTKAYDPSRLVNPASGGNHYETGDILDIHNYPDPVLAMFTSRRACVLGEYGGIGLALEGHLWETGRNWGYVQYKTSEEATDAYVKLAEKLLTLIPAGYSAAVYTQTTDVEIEVNGLMTYDRKVVKLDKAKVAEINRKVCKSLNSRE